MAPLMMGMMMLDGAAPGRAESPRVIALGTSLTARGGWREPLAVALRQCRGDDASVMLVAKPGATSDWGRGEIDRVLAGKPDIVLVEFAVNDAALQNFVSLARSRENITAIVAALKPSTQIYLMAMNPVQGLRGWARPQLALYEEAHRQAAKDQGAGFIDHRIAWAKLPAGERHRLIPDGLHPDPASAGDMIAATILRELCREGRAPWRH